MFSDEEKARAWSQTADVVKTYSDEMVKRWNMEIDALLVFVSTYTIYFINASGIETSRTSRLVCSLLY